MDLRCRLCLKYSSEVENLFGDDPKYKNIRSLIELIAGISIQKSTRFPLNICRSCIEIVDILVNFKNTIQNSQRILENEQEIVIKTEENQINSELELNETNHIEELINVDINHEENQFDYEPIIDFSDIVPKPENISNVSLEDKVIKADKQVKRKRKLRNSQIREIKNTTDNSKILNKSNEDILSQENILIEQIDNEFSKPIKSTKKKTKVKKSNTKQGNTKSNRNTLETSNNKSLDEKINLEKQSTIKTWRKYKASYEVTCHICGKLISKFILQNHINSHLGLRPYKCDVENCNKSFPTPTNLLQHKRVHSDEARFKCYICNKSFKSGYQLRLHQTYHFDPQLPCNICGKLLRNQRTLKKHLFTHTNERPHKCNLCDSAFKTKPSLKVHYKMHTKEKPYSCQLCDKAFTYKQMLKQHCVKYHQKEIN